LLLLLAGALLVHLFMLTDVGASQIEQHAETDASMAGVGGLHTDLEAASPDDQPQAMGHAMAVACVAVLAAGGSVLGLRRALAQRDALSTARISAAPSMVRRIRNLWPPPRAESSRVDGGVLLLI
jgi:hypothetical protein